MGASKIQICNMALGAFGQRAIASIDEQTPSARACKLFYDQARQGSLRGIPWRFASVVTALTLVADQTIPGWNFLYGYPATALDIQKVYSDLFADNASSAPYLDDSDFIFNGVGRYNDYDRKHRMSDPFRICKNPDLLTSALVIACDTESAIVEYVNDEINNDLFDSNFVDALVFKLASMIAKPLTGDDATVRDMIGLYQATLDKAKLVNSNQEFMRPHNISTTVNAR